VQLVGSIVAIEEIESIVIDGEGSSDQPSMLSIELILFFLDDSMSSMQQILIVDIVGIDMYVVVLAGRDIGGYPIGVGQDVDGLFDEGVDELRFLFGCDEVVLDGREHYHVSFDVLHAGVNLFVLFSRFGTVEGGEEADNFGFCAGIAAVDVDVVSDSADPVEIFGDGHKVLEHESSLLVEDAKGSEHFFNRAKVGL
jgi:hypothetical protein